MKKYTITVLYLFTLLNGISAHSGKPKYHVIIDNDGAIDDMRAISILLSGNDIRVLAITCSQGTLMPNTVFDKTKSLLSAFHHEGIPMGISEKLNQTLPFWSSFAQDIIWGNNQNKSDYFKPKSNDVLNKCTENYKGKITLIALGTLQTYAEWLEKNPEKINKIERIIWYNNHKLKEGFNFKISPKSYDFIKKTGIQLDIVENNSLINNDYINKLKQTNSKYAQQIVKVHQQKSVIEKIKQNHIHLWDDIVPLYLTVPILFETKKEKQINFVSLNKSIKEDDIHEILCKLLVSSTQTNNRVFINFPTDTLLYKKNYAKILKSTLKKYGANEWKAISLTNEIHGHTGIYSIIGAKMGIRAIEYFNVGVNNLRVTSFAGKKPPLSCFNDGIQISTGSTIGQGLISISDKISKIPSATFEFNNHKIHISVKKEIAEKMQIDIKYGVKTYGLLTDKYWKYIENLALKYWVNYNRNEIFIIKIITKF